MIPIVYFHMCKQFQQQQKQYQHSFTNGIGSNRTVLAVELTVAAQY